MLTKGALLLRIYAIVFAPPLICLIQFILGYVKLLVIIMSARIESI